MTAKPPTPRPGSIAAQIVALFDSGVTDTKEIAHRVGRTRPHVNGALRNAGRLNPRPRGRPIGSKDSRARKPA
jgi:hypothetical protein